MMEDWQLLREYAAGGSETAFRELMERHLDFVYATAHRRLGDAHAAEDVCQAVFCLLARKAAQLKPSGPLVGWLYQTAYFMAARHQLVEHRRLRREHAAADSIVEAGAGETSWETIAPVLDEAMQQLPEPERQLLLLRFFKGTSFSETGRTMGISEDAARMRVNRTLDKLRELLQQRGITSTTAALALVLEQKAVEAAPAVSAQAIQAAVLRAIATASAPSLIQTALNFMKQSPVTTVFIAGAALLLALIATLHFYNRAATPLAQATDTPRPTFSPAHKEGAQKPALASRRPSSRQNHNARATTADSEPPAQVYIEAKFIELPAIVAETISILKSPSASACTVIPEEQKIRDLINRLDQTTGVDIMSAPSVTTLSGQQAHIGITFTLSDSFPQPNTISTNQMTIEPGIGFIPYVESDNSIRLSLMAIFEEFLGWQAAHAARKNKGIIQPESSIFSTLPLPVIPSNRSDDFVAKATMQSGQWILYGPFFFDKQVRTQKGHEASQDRDSSRNDETEENASTTSQPPQLISVKYARYVLATACVLDSAGNRVADEK